MKVFDFKGELIRQFGSAKDETWFIDSWENKKANELYIINANDHDLKLYEFPSGKLFKSFVHKEKISIHMSAFIMTLDGKNTLVENDKEGYIRLWDIETTNLIKTIKIGGHLRGLILWEANYLICAGHGSMKVIDINGGSVACSLAGGHKSSSPLGTIVKLNHPELGECLLSGGGAVDNQICLWKLSPVESKK